MKKKCYNIEYKNNKEEEDIMKKEEKKEQNWFLSLLPYLVILIVVILFKTYLYSPVIVNGDSMKETLFDHDIMILDKISYS